LKKTLNSSSCTITFGRLLGDVTREGFEEFEGEGILEITGEFLKDRAI